MAAAAVPRGTPRPQGVLLWDIDGTLVRWVDDHQSHHSVVVADLLGSSRHWETSAAGLTDYELMLSLAPSVIRLDRDTMDTLLRDLDQRFVQATSSDQLEALPGVAEYLVVASDCGWVNGLLTGNTRTRAIHKLSTVGLLHHFDLAISAFGDTPVTRSELAIHSVARLKLQHGGSMQVALVGDTPRDVEAAKAACVPSLLVVDPSRTSPAACEADFVLKPGENRPQELRSVLESLNRR